MSRRPPAATVDGRIAVPPARYVELDGGASARRVWQNLDPARIAAASGLTLLPVVVEQDAAAAPTASSECGPPPTAASTRTAFGSHPQRYAFAALAAGLWIGFAVRRAMRRRRPR